MKKAICLGCIPGETAEEKFANAVTAGFDGVEVGTLIDTAQMRSYKRLSQIYKSKCIIFNY
ncbi:MAG: hypothetical protein GX094_04240 [Clostridiales bacterium]|jgi:sugar phosphate isomerase/epimerase|nr:hypothetical protein [Clostridiales bacterium]